MTEKETGTGKHRKFSDSDYSSNDIALLREIKAAGMHWHVVVNILNLAAVNGHLEALKWLVEESEQPLDPALTNSKLVQWAATHSDLDAVKWLVEESRLVVDCRECETWFHLTRFDEKIKDYLRGVRKLQDEHSVQYWKRARPIEKPTKPRLQL